MTPRGTYRIADERPVDFTEAKAAWAVAARSALIHVAQQYHLTITYAALAEAVQVDAGIRTGALMHYWIGGVLEDVALDCHRRGEPLLSALCVHTDGTVGEGYGRALEGTGLTPTDLDMHAADERLACYRSFGAELPADGGRPALTPQVAARRAKAKRAAAADRKRPACPTCFLELPATGQCDNCA